MSACCALEGDENDDGVIVVRWWWWVVYITNNDLPIFLFICKVSLRYHMISLYFNLPMFQQTKQVMKYYQSLTEDLYI